MSRKKLFIQNFISYGLIDILNRLVPFLLLPIITKLLPNTSDFGIYSMFLTIIGFGVPLAILGLYDSMFREFFEYDDMNYKYSVTKTAQRVIMFSSLTITIILIVFNSVFSKLFFGTDTYGHIVIMAGIGILLGANISPLHAPTRMLNHRKIFIISGLLSSVIQYGVALFLIVIGYSYFGLIYSSILASIIMVIFFFIRNNEYFTKGTFDFKIAKKLLIVGLPLMPTFLFYWVFSSMDKIMISNILGISELGIYSIGAKVAQISMLIYVGFAGSWQYFSFSTMKDFDQVELNSKIFEYLGVISVLSFITLYPLMPLIFNILFIGDYVSGYKVAGLLYLSPLLLMLFQVIGNQFLIFKKSYFISLSLIVGVVANFILNYYLINMIGIKGAAISTLIGYLITLVIIMLISTKMKYMFFSKRIISILFIIPFYIVIQDYVINSLMFLQYLLMLSTIALISVMYNKELKSIFKIIKKIKLS